MKNLKLNKQTITTLSSKDMSQVNGGGLFTGIRAKHSNNKDTECKYSQNTDNVQYQTQSNCVK